MAQKKKNDASSAQDAGSISLSNAVIPNIFVKHDYVILESCDHHMFVVDRNAVYTSGTLHRVLKELATYDENGNKFTQKLEDEDKGRGTVDKVTELNSMKTTGGGNHFPSTKELALFGIAPLTGAKYHLQGGKALENVQGSVDLCFSDADVSKVSNFVFHYHHKRHCLDTNPAHTRRILCILANGDVEVIVNAERDASEMAGMPRLYLPQGASSTVGGGVDESMFTGEDNFTSRGREEGLGDSSVQAMQGAFVSRLGVPNATPNLSGAKLNAKQLQQLRAQQEQEQRAAIELQRSKQAALLIKEKREKPITHLYLNKISEDQLELAIKFMYYKYYNDALFSPSLEDNGIGVTLPTSLKGKDAGKFGGVGGLSDRHRKSFFGFVSDHSYVPTFVDDKGATITATLNGVPQKQAAAGSGPAAEGGAKEANKKGGGRAGKNAIPELPAMAPVAAMMVAAEYIEDGDVEETMNAKYLKALSLISDTVDVPINDKAMTLCTIRSDEGVVLLPPAFTDRHLMLLAVCNLLQL